MTVKLVVMYSGPPLVRTTWDQGNCPNNEGVLISGVEDVLYQSIINSELFGSSGMCPQ